MCCRKKYRGTTQCQKAIICFKDLVQHQVFIYVLLLLPVEENNLNLIFLSHPTALENVPPEVSP